MKGGGLEGGGDRLMGERTERDSLYSGNEQEHRQPDSIFDQVARHVAQVEALQREVNGIREDEQRIAELGKKFGIDLTRSQQEKIDAAKGLEPEINEVQMKIAEEKSSAENPEIAQAPESSVDQEDLPEESTVQQEWILQPNRSMKSSPSETPADQPADMSENPKRTSPDLSEIAPATESPLDVTEIPQPAKEAEEEKVQIPKALLEEELSAIETGPPKEQTADILPDNIAPTKRFPEAPSQIGNNENTLETTGMDIKEPENKGRLETLSTEEWESLREDIDASERNHGNPGEWVTNAFISGVLLKGTEKERAVSSYAGIHELIDRFLEDREKALEEKLGKTKNFEEFRSILKKEEVIFNTKDEEPWIFDSKTLLEKIDKAYKEGVVGDDIPEVSGIREHLKRIMLLEHA